MTSQTTNRPPAVGVLGAGLDPCVPSTMRTLLCLWSQLHIRTGLPSGICLMDRPASKRQRCAIYTRKSTDHNLDLEFNSLDAQREACEAYIKSQAHEGWRLVPARYDDGAFSGASLERPALQALLAEVAAGRIDVIVVYKVDRLTRSLADFAKLVELFDRHGVSFVSITQSFNTTSSMGRLTLNVLLVLRPVRARGDRRTGARQDRCLQGQGPVDGRARSPWAMPASARSWSFVPKEAQTVRSIFQRYLQLGSIGALAEDLDRQGHPDRAPGHRARARSAAASPSASVRWPTFFATGSISARWLSRQGPFG